MFKYLSLKKYSIKLLPILERHYGKKTYYSATEVRATIYQHDFNPKYLPLAYLMFLEENMLNSVLYIEFPELDIEQYKKDIVTYLEKKNFAGSLTQLL